jgi:hypothetical protein
MELLGSEQRHASGSSGRNTVITRVTSDLQTNFSANEDFFAVFLDSANEYGFG